MDKKKREKMTLGQIVRLCAAILAIIMTMGGFILAFMWSSIPKSAQFLPFLLLIAAVAILLVLKTTGRYANVADKMKNDLSDEEKRLRQEADDQTISNEEALQEPTELEEPTAENQDAQQPASPDSKKK